MTEMLEVTDLEVAYGRVRAVRGISLRVQTGQIVCLLGANGAGKSTTLRTISGLLRPQSGTISFEGERIDGRKPHRIVAMGIAQVPEGRRIFPDMSVEDNLLLGSFARRDPGVNADRDEIYDLFSVLAERRRQQAGLLSGGEQQMLAIGRAMMSRPRLLMLDEPSMGLSPIMTATIMRTINHLHQAGVTILLVEQNARMALALSEEGYVLELGRISHHDTGAALLSDDRIRRAYLGVD